jgi:hypothetical protein
MSTVMRTAAPLPKSRSNRAQVTVNIRTSAEWLAVREAVFAALASYPETLTFRLVPEMGASQ